MSSWFQTKATSTKFVVASLAAACLLSPWGAAATCNSYYTTAVELLQALYPDLKGKNVMIETMIQEPFDSDKPPSHFAIGISELHPTEPITGAVQPNLSSAERVGHLSTHFEFDPRNDHLVWMSASGSYVSTEKGQQLKNHVDEHPNWSEREMTDALSAAGAKFGPNAKEAILATFPKNQLEPILGNIEVRSAALDFRRESGMEWVVRFRASNAESSTEYFVLMEPFAGKVVLLGSTPFDAGHATPKNQ